MKVLSSSLRTIPLLLLAACAAAPDGPDEPSDSTSEGIIPIGIIKNPGIPIGPIQVFPQDPQFTIRALGKMCLDIGGQAYWAVGAPVTLYWCNGTVAQQFGVREVAGAGHDVNLRVGSNFCVGIRGGTPALGAALELQACNGSPAQQFALDGDSIMAGTSSKPTTEAILVRGIGGIGTLPVPVYPVHRSFVWKPQNDVTGAKTPMVLGTREVTENEYLRFTAVDGSNTPPHSGFVRPADGPGLLAALQSASWGTVVELADGVYDVSGTTGTQIGAGVTLRGYRKRTDNGPQITFNQDIGHDVFFLASDDIRVTGLRLQGPTDSTDTGQQIGIDINEGFRVLVDHVEASRFPVTAIAVHGGYTTLEKSCTANANGIPAAPRPTYVNIARNFIHHNEGSEAGYGVSSTKGAFAVIEGNTEYMNRHNITSDYQPESGYIANDNLVLSNHPTYYDGLQNLWDFDVHGSDGGITGKIYEGGIAGDYVLIQYNTFLATRTNINIRGVPCGTAGLIDGNIFVHPMGSSTDSNPPVWIADAVSTLDYDGAPVQYPANITITANNGFNVENPTNHLATGDFDGDGIDDVFLGTGNGWFYQAAEKHVAWGIDSRDRV